MASIQCNIDEHGRAVRLQGGYTLGAGAALLGLVGFALGSRGVLALAATAGAVSGIMLFEGYTRWCVARAAGFNTPV
jgi:hypothetical protein